MAQDWAKWFYDSKEWKKARYSYIGHRRKIDGGVCEDCKTEPGYIVHHKIHLTRENINDPDISLNHANFKYVCKACHEYVEHADEKKNVLGAIKYVFDANGQLIPVNE